MKLSNITFLTDAQKKMLASNVFVKSYRENIRPTLIEALKKLLTTGFVRTGKSGFSNGHGTKNIITDEVMSLANSLQLPAVRDNDAPRGGANGEHVKLVF